MIRSRSRQWFLMAAAPLAVLLAVMTLAGGAARRAAAHEEGEAHPVHIHSGTCANLGDVVAPLSELGAATDLQGTPVAEEGAAMGAESAIPVDVSVTTVEMSLADIVEGGHAINAHESAENIQNYIACGDIGGTMLGDTLVIGLAEVNESGYSGVATLQDQGDSTLVTVFLAEQHAEGAEAEGTPPAGTPAAATGDEVAVDISGFAYNPAELTVPVGTTVTWTNSDDAPHTATAEGQTFQSGRLDPGATFSYTFEEAGEFPYYCEFHPNMTATIIVE